jgi:hypothetical protein
MHSRQSRYGVLGTRMESSCFRARRSVLARALTGDAYYVGEPRVTRTLDRRNILYETIFTQALKRTM